MTTIDRSGALTVDGIRRTRGRDEAGIALKSEAIRQLDGRNWRAVAQLAAAAQDLREDDLELEGIAVLAVAHGKSAAAQQAMDRFRQRLETGQGDPATRAAGWTHLAAAQLARRNYRLADAHARRALALDDRNVTAWWSLAASFGGLGWFDEMSTCIQRAEAIGPPSRLASWQVGRAINDWGLTKTPAVAATVVGVLLIGVLGLAVGITTPLLVRELRVGRLTPTARGLAAAAWQGETKTRLVAAGAVGLVVMTWALLVATIGVG